MRIARHKGIDIQTLVGEEFKPAKKLARDEHRQKIMDSLFDFDSNDEQQTTIYSNDDGEEGDQQSPSNIEQFINSN